MAFNINKRRTTRSLLAAIAFAGIGAFALQPVAHAAAESQASATTSADGFEHHSVVANGVRLHYVTVGKGEPALLMPGWPESWYAWRFVMRDLAASGRKAVAVDPRGFGDSEKPATGFDLKTASDDMHAFIQAAGLARAGGIDVVSHDLGAWIAYAHASAYPQDVRRLVLSEATMPGTTPAGGVPSDEADVKTWHFAFNRLNDLPETLVQGHERPYLSWLFANKSIRNWKIDPAALDEYVRVFSAPGAARAGFDYYRQAFSAAGLAQAKERTAHKLAMPVFTLGGSGGLGQAMLKSVQPLAENASGTVLEECGHYLPEECDVEYVRAVRNFWQTTPVAAGR